MKNFLLLILVLLGSVSAIAQQGKTMAGMPQKVKNAADTVPRQRNLQVIGRSYGDSIVLRWAPTEAYLWYFANKSGYQVIRYEVENKKMVPGSKT